MKTNNITIYINKTYYNITFYISIYREWYII